MKKRMAIVGGIMLMAVGAMIGAAPVFADPAYECAQQGGTLKASGNNYICSLKEYGGGSGNSQDAQDCASRGGNYGRWNNSYYCIKSRGTLDSTPTNTVLPSNGGGSSDDSSSGGGSDASSGSDYDSVNSGSGTTWVTDNSGAYKDSKECDDGKVKTNFFGNDQCIDGQDGIFMVLNVLLSVLTWGIGIAGTLGIVISGIQYMTAKDDPVQMTKAKNRLIQIIIGLAIYAVMWAFLQWLLPGGVFGS